MHHIRLARTEDLSALPEIERQANTLFAAYGLAEQLSDVPTPIESLREGAQADRLWVAADEDDYHTITLTTLRHIPWNAPWYQRLGFRVLETGELSEALRDLLQQEIQRGLPADQRVAMCCDLYDLSDPR